MTSPSVTYTLTNGSVSDATQVATNFNDIIASLTDSTNDLSIAALTCSGTATLNGSVNLGNSTSDDLAITARLLSNLIPKTTNAYDLGSSSLRYATVYGVAGNFSGALTIAGAVTLNGAVTLGDATGDDLVATGRWASNLVPKTTNTYDLGTSSLRYGAVYSVDGNFSGTMAVSGAVSMNGDVTLGNASSDDIIFTGRLAGHTLPKTDDTYDLGSASLRYRVVYADEINFGQTDMNHYEQADFTGTMVDDPGLANPTVYGSVSLKCTRIGNRVFVRAIHTAGATLTSRWFGTIPMSTFTGNFAYALISDGAGTGFRTNSASDKGVCRMRTVSSTDSVQFDAYDNSSNSIVTWIWNFSYVAA